jgi:hypothetical protein
VTDFIIGALFIVAALAGLTAQTAYALRIQRRHAAVVPELDSPAYAEGREAFLGGPTCDTRASANEVLIALRMDIADALIAGFGREEVEANVCYENDDDTIVHVCLPITAIHAPADITRWIRATYNLFAVGRWEVVEAYRDGVLDSEVSTWTCDAPEAHWRDANGLLIP